MKNYGWKGYIPALGVEKYAYRTIATTVPIPNVQYGWSAPQLDQGQTPTCGPHSFVELYYTTMRQNGREPVLLDPFELTKAYADYTGQPFDGVYNRIMMLVAHQLYKFRAYHTVAMDRDEILNCLAEGYNFLVGIPVYENFDNATDGIVGMPEGKWLGGHDVLIQGYDLVSYDEPMVYGQNHWKDWGFEGRTYLGNCHFRMPLRFLTELGMDAWTITLT